MGFFATCYSGFACFTVIAYYLLIAISFCLQVQCQWTPASNATAPVASSGLNGALKTTCNKELTIESFYAENPELRPLFSGQPPNIAWVPDYEEYLRRTERRKLDENLPKSVPQGFPARVDEPCTWSGKDLKDTTSWVIRFSENHIQEIEDALKHFKGHITDTGDTIVPKGHAIPTYSNVAQPFHTDLGDIVSLYTIDQAAEGGSSKIASISQIYNVIAANRPDIIHTLSGPWVFDGFGTEPPYSVHPVLFYESGRLIANFARRLFTGQGPHTRSKYLPPISESQADALDTVEFVARDQALTMRLERGDIQLINNLALLHGRDKFDDGKNIPLSSSSRLGGAAPPQSQGRYLLRIWLRDEKAGWKIPKALKAEWERVFNSFSPEEHKFSQGPTVQSCLSVESGCS